MRISEYTRKIGRTALVQSKTDGTASIYDVFKLCHARNQNDQQLPELTLFSVVPSPPTKKKQKIMPDTGPRTYVQIEF